MESPEAHSRNDAVPAGVSVPINTNQARSSSDTISQLSQSSTGVIPLVSSPITGEDIGVLRTPEVRVVAPIDNEAIEEGYDSDGLRAPWEGVDEVDGDGSDLQEESLPIGAPPLSPEGPLQQNA